MQSILNFGGRFLISTGDKGKPWAEIDFKRAVQKTSQALRERGSGTPDDNHTIGNSDLHRPMEQKGQEDKPMVRVDHDGKDPLDDAKKSASETQIHEKADHGFNCSNYEAI